MELVILIALVVVVAAVAVDAIRKRPQRTPKPGDPTITTTQKIIVDLSKRR